MNSPSSLYTAWLSSSVLKESAVHARGGEGEERMVERRLIPINGCPDCGARSVSHEKVGTFLPVAVRRCSCGGLYDAGIMGGPEIPASPKRVEKLREARERATR